jgi:hypothetical protein
MKEDENVEKGAEKQMSETGVSPQKPEISRGLKIFDFILAGISAIEFIWKIITKLSGTPRGWLDVLLPLFLVIGLLSHDKRARVVCVILLVVSILNPIILGGIVAGTIGY